MTLAMKDRETTNLLTRLAPVPAQSTAYASTGTTTPHMNNQEPAAAPDPNNLVIWDLRQDFEDFQTGWYEELNQQIQGHDGNANVVRGST